MYRIFIRKTTSAFIRQAVFLAAYSLTLLHAYKPRDSLGAFVILAHLYFCFLCNSTVANTQVYPLFLVIYILFIGLLTFYIISTNYLHYGNSPNTCQYYF